jgi:hypothetical protein
MPVPVLPNLFAFLATVMMVAFGSPASFRADAPCVPVPIEEDAQDTRPFGDRSEESSQDSGRVARSERRPISTVRASMSRGHSPNPTVGVLEPTAPFHSSDPSIVIQYCRLTT